LNSKLSASFTTNAYANRLFPHSDGARYLITQTPTYAAEAETHATATRPTMRFANR